MTSLMTKWLPMRNSHVGCEGLDSKTSDYMVNWLLQSDWESSVQETQHVNVYTHNAQSGATLKSSQSKLEGMCNLWRCADCSYVFL